jgi:heme/copper-type cytochrome/quinol oxidase subunit 2
MSDAQWAQYKKDFLKIVGDSGDHLKQVKGFTAANAMCQENKLVLSIVTPILAIISIMLFMYRVFRMKGFGIQDLNKKTVMSIITFIFVVVLIIVAAITGSFYTSDRAACKDLKKSFVDNNIQQIWYNERSVILDNPLDASDVYTSVDDITIKDIFLPQANDYTRDVTSMDVNEATARWKDYADFITNRDNIAHLKNENVTSMGELKEQIRNTLVALVFIFVFVALGAFITYKTYKSESDEGLKGESETDNVDGGNRPIVLMWIGFIIISLLLGLLVIYRNFEYVTAANKKYDDLKIQYIWDNHLDVIQENKLFVNDNSYNQVSDIKFSNDIFTPDKNQ